MRLPGGKNMKWGDGHPCPLTTLLERPTCSLLRQKRAIMYWLQDTGEYKSSRLFTMNSRTQKWQCLSSAIANVHTHQNKGGVYRR